jgi:hypothetical protein
MTTAVATVQGPADLRDQKWLDGRVAVLGDGIEAAQDIWSNWADGRGVGRLHPGLTPGQYIDSLGLRLTLTEALAALPTASSREVARVAGVDQKTVVNRRRAEEYSSPVAVTGADGKTYPARVIRDAITEVVEPDDPVPIGVSSPFWDQLLAVRDSIRELEGVGSEVLAASVPVRRRQAFAKELRRSGRVLGGVAAILEVMK